MSKFYTKNLHRHKEKRFLFTLIADDRWCDLQKEINKQIERVRKIGDNFEIQSKRYLSFEDGSKQIRVNVIGKIVGTWNDVYDIVNSIRSQKIVKL
jgi:hypothetical protein